MRQRLALLLLLGLVGSPSLPAAVWEGFELGATRWSSGEEGGLIKAAISRDVASEGGHAFGGRVEIADLASKPKAGFWLLPDADFTGIESFHFDLFNGTRAAWKAKLIIQTGSDWGWNEADLGTLKPGWNKGLGVDLRNGFGGKGLASFKSVPKISILLEPQEATQGALYLDNVQLSGPGAEALAPKVLVGAREQLLDSFEGPVSEFKPIAGAAVRTEPDPDHATQGGQGLKLVAVTRDPEADATFGYDKAVDLSNVQSAVMDIYNPGPPAMLGFATGIGEKWDYAAGPSQRLRTGWNRDVTFNFQAHDFKYEATHWKNNGPLPSFKVRRFAFVWNPGDTGSLSLTIDRLRLRAMDDTAIKALAPAPAAKGWESPLWNGSGGAPAKAGADQPHARSAAWSPAYSLPGEGRSLRLGWQASERGQSADFEWTLPVDLRGVRALRLDVYNPGADAVDLALALQAGPTQDWMETQPLRLAPGWNHGLEIPLEGPVFKAASSQWAVGASLPGRSPEVLVRAYWHVAVPGPGIGELYLARAVAVRRSAWPGSELPLSAEGQLSGELKLEPVAWELWDSGAGEGTFEKGLGAWTGNVGAAADGASVVSLGSEGASQGKSAMKVEVRGDGNNKASAIYDPSLGAPLPDLSQVDRLRFDVYNPGMPLGFSLAFTVGAANVWTESLQVPLHSGWNRDVTFDLTAPVWKATVSGGSATGATQIYGYFPPDHRGPGQLTKLNLLFQKSRSGTVWVDNIRLGRSGSGSSHVEEGELGLRGQVGPLELKAAVKAGNSADGSAWAQLGASHAAVHGAGQELAFSVGEAVPAFDDLLGLYTGRRQFDNQLSGSASIPMDQVGALHWKGDLAGVQAQAFGAVPWGAVPYSFGGQAFGGLRLKAAGPSGTWLGGTWLHQRLGYDPGAVLGSSPVEQSSQVLAVDGQVGLPWGFNVAGAYGRTEWGADPERMLLHDPQGLPQLWSRPLDPGRNAVKAQATWSSSALDLSGSYSDVGLAFDTGLSDVLYNAVRDEAKALFRPAGLGWKPADDAKGLWPGLGRGLNLTLQTYSHASADKTYAGRTEELRVENSRDTPLGYVVSVANKDESKATNTGDPLLPSLHTQWGKLILRGQPWDGFGWQLGGQWRSYDFVTTQARDSTYGLELSQRFLRVHVLSAAVASFGQLEGAGLPGGSTSAAWAAWKAQWRESLSSELSYGRPPLGYELSMTWPVTDPTTRLRLEASF